MPKSLALRDQNNLKLQYGRIYPSDLTVLVFVPYPGTMTSGLSRNDIAAMFQANRTQVHEAEHATYLSELDLELALLPESQADRLIEALKIPLEATPALFRERKQIASMIFAKGIYDETERKRILDVLSQAGNSSSSDGHALESFCQRILNATRKVNVVREETDELENWETLKHFHLKQILFIETLTRWKPSGLPDPIAVLDEIEALLPEMKPMTLDSFHGFLDMKLVEAGFQHGGFMDMPPNQVDRRLLLAAEFVREQEASKRLRIGMHLLNNVWPISTILDVLISREPTKCEPERFLPNYPSIYSAGFWSPAGREAKITDFMRPSGIDELGFVGRRLSVFRHIVDVSGNPEDHDRVLLMLLNYAFGMMGEDFESLARRYLVTPDIFRWALARTVFSESAREHYGNDGDIVEFLSRFNKNEFFEVAKQFISDVSDRRRLNTLLGEREQQIWGEWRPQLTA